MTQINKIYKLMMGMALLLVPIFASSQVTLVKKGKAQGKILVPVKSSVDDTAARLLQDFTERISGVVLPIEYTEKKPSKGDVIICTTPTKGVGEDGFSLQTSDGYLLISGGKGKGTIYGVVTLLEQYLGCHYWSENEYFVPNLSTIALPAISVVDNPAFIYRQSQNYALATDSIYKMWYRLEEPREQFAANYWVHTANRLLPAEQYGQDHPEYYAYYNGKRHPGKASQLCLTNPEVFEIVAQRIDSIFLANPGKNMISFSQNDGNFTNCQCVNCKRIDEHEGALSGSVIHFLNKLATRFPDKEFSTLAYLYTMNPPMHVKPLPNVNIMLCDIDCRREVSLTENDSGREFMKALEGWSAITDNIFVWDYGINFDGYLTPFPNFHILQDNIRIFKKNHVKMHFSQIAGSRGGDFAELRTYLVSKLMWNPEADVDSLTHVFMQGYYKEAAPYIYRYTKMIEGALLGSGIGLWIYDSPVTHKGGMLKPELMRRYNQLFDAAESAVAHDDVALTHVRRTRLPLQYSELEIARTENEKEVDVLIHKLDLFEERVKTLRVSALNERMNSPLNYVNLYKKRYLPRKSKNLARNAEISFSPEPAKRYLPISDRALTDGLYGGATFVDSWVGWEGTDATIVLNLGNEQTFRRISADFLHQLGQWVLLPVQVKYWVSVDGEHYEHLGSYDIPEHLDRQVLFESVTHESSSDICAQYIKLEIVGTKICPPWHWGVGHPCWFFLDEIDVQ